MNNKLIIIVLMLAPMCNAMDVKESKLATRQEISTLLHGVFTGFPFESITEPLNRIETVFTLLEHRQNVWKFPTKNILVVLNKSDSLQAQNDIELWDGLQEVIKNFRLHIESFRRESEYNQKTSKMCEELRDRSTLLYALASKGLSLELTRSVEFSQSPLIRSQFYEIEKSLLILPLEDDMVKIAGLKRIRILLDKFNGAFPYSSCDPSKDLQKAYDLLKERQNTCIPVEESLGDDVIHLRDIPSEKHDEYFWRMLKETVSLYRERMTDLGERALKDGYVLTAKKYAENRELSDILYNKVVEGLELELSTQGKRSQIESQIQH